MVRECFVPTCKNNTKNSRNKLFVRIREDMRERWCREVNAEYFKVYTMYCCEDHFDPQIDLKNYLKCKLMNKEPMFKPTAILRNISLPIPQDDPNVLQPECSELYKLLLNDQSETRPPEKRIKLDTALQSTSGSISNQDSINRKPVQNASPVGDSLQASSSGKEVLRHEEPKPNSSTLKCDSPPVDDLDDNTSVAAEGALEDYTSADDTGPVQFSWQNSEQISIDEDGDCVPDDAPPIVPTLEMIVENVSKQDVEADINIKPEKHTEYFCDCCSKEIIGFRYTCVQCDNFDLCCSCESKLLHPHHYMLRVPGHKPFSEVNSILEAIREKIKLLTEEAQNSEGLQLDEIKLEEPQFEEVTVDPFSEVTIPVADDHTTQLQAHTSENKSDTTHTIETKASDMQKEPKIDQPKAPMKIAIRKDVFFKAYKKKTAGEKTIVQLKAIEMQAKNIAPIILQKQRSVVVPQLLNCRVGLSRLKTTQVETHPSTSSQGSASKTTVKQKSLGVKDLDSEARIARENLEENDQEVEMEISRNQKFTSIVKKKQDEATRTQSEEFLDEMWLDDI